MRFKDRTPHQKKVDKVDWVAKGVILLAGWMTIFSVAAIMLFILSEVYPLFKSPEFKKESFWDISARIGPEKTLAAGTDEYREIGFRLTDKGSLDFVSLRKENTGRSFVIDHNDHPSLNGARLTATWKHPEKQEYFFGTDDGRIGVVDISFKPDFSAAERAITQSVEFSDTWQVFEDETPIRLVAGAMDEDGNIKVIASTESGINYFTYDGEMEESSVTPLSGIGDPVVTAMAMPTNGDFFVLGTDKGVVHVYELSGSQPRKVEDFIASNLTITRMAYLIGNEALLVGDESGLISEWFRLRHVYAKNVTDHPRKVEGHTLKPGQVISIPDQDFLSRTDSYPGVNFSPHGIRYVNIRAFKGADSPVEHLTPSPRDKGFISGHLDGTVAYHYSTPGRTYERLTFKGSLAALEISPKSDGFIAIGDDGVLYDYEMRVYHPDISPGVLFSPVWYEGYPEPDIVWQSTGGTDEFEPKFSLWPLIFGTLKGTLYAMVFSVPIAIMAALYISQIAPPKLANIVKPAIELMAAMPSVVVGFLAGLWLAPVMDKNLIEFFMMAAFIPVGWVALVAVFAFMPEEKRPNWSGTYELLYLLPPILLFAILGILVGPWVELAFFGGDIKEWLLGSMDILYDPRNSIVVGFALGFAVIPIIFTISEDAMSSVPKVLTSAAFALAATRWQTALYVVLPAASPGIFAAVMLGLGRAVGETMIVLMATGNTPVMDMSIFNGFRAMSAAIAVEMPEAPVGGSLYRILFLVGLILFVFTFLINTLASVISARLRHKYSRF